MYDTLVMAVLSDTIAAANLSPEQGCRKEDTAM